MLRLSVWENDEQLTSSMFIKKSSGRLVWTDVQHIFLITEKKNPRLFELVFQCFQTILKTPSDAMGCHHRFREDYLTI